MCTNKASEIFKGLREREFGTIPTVQCGFEEGGKNEFTDFTKDMCELQLKTNPKIPILIGMAVALHEIY